MGKKKSRGTKRPDALNRQQEKFCQHFALHGNGAEAYGHAYPVSRKGSPQYRANQAAKMLSQPKIRARIAKLGEKVERKADEQFDISANRVLQEIAAIAMYNSEDYFDWGVQYIPKFNRKTGEPVLDKDGNQVTEPRPYAIPKPASQLSRQQKSAVIGAEMSFTREGIPIINVKMGDKLNALKMLGMYHKLFNQKIEHEVGGKGGGPVQIKDVSDVKALDPVTAMKAFEAFRQSLAGA